MRVVRHKPIVLLNKKGIDSDKLSVSAMKRGKELRGTWAGMVCHLVTVVATEVMLRIKRTTLTR